MVRAVVGDGWFQAEAAHRFNATPKTVSKWIEPFEAEGVEGLRDRSSRPLASPKRSFAGHVHDGRGVAQAALCRRADRSRDRRFASGPQPHSQGLTSVSTGCRRWSRPSRFAAIGAPPPARSSTSTSRSSASSIGSVTAYRQPDGPEQHPRGGLGIHASGDRRPFATRLLGSPP